MLKTSSLFTQLNTFLMVVDEGSLTAAAKKMNRSPSAVSKSLSLLEKSLDKTLIKRDTRSFSLTEEGKACYAKARTISDHLDAFTRDEQDSKDTGGEIWVNSSTAFGLSQLAPLLGAFQRQHPHVLCNLAISDEHVDLIHSNTDIAFRITNKTDWKHPAKKLAHIRWHYCASPSYIESAREIHHPLDLVNHACLVYPGMSQNGKWLFRDGSQNKTVDVKASFTSNSSAVLKTLCLQGAGIACLPSYLIPAEVTEGSLRILLPAFQCGYSHDLYAMYYQAKHQSRFARALIDYAAEAIGSVPFWDRAIEEHAL